MVFFIPLLDEMIIFSFLGAQIITYGNTYCSKYNKAEAMELFMMRKKAKNRKTVIFVGMPLIIFLFKLVKKTKES